MIVINISGGLGNQLFQYALGESLKGESVEVSYHSSVLKGFRSYRLNSLIPDIKLIDPTNVSSANRFYLKNRRRRGLCKPFRLIYSRVINYVIIEDNDVNYKKAMFKSDQFLEGHWQNIRYFDKIKSVLRDKIVLSPELESESYRMYLNQIKSIKSSSVSIHVRRSDYIHSKGLSVFKNITEGTYYQDAIDYINRTVKNCHYFIFSDDIEWCKNNLEINNATFIEPKSDMKDYHDFTLIRSCKHHINANSTFSWWAAYLGSDKSSCVIIPKIWFTEEKRQQRYNKGNLHPENWKKI